MTTTGRALGLEGSRPNFHRRQVVLIVLLVAAAVSLAVSLIASRASLWGVQLLADGLLGGYLVLLVHVRNSAALDEMNFEGEDRRSPAYGDR